MAKQKAKWLNIIKPRLVLKIPLMKLAEKTKLWLNVSVPGSLNHIRAGVFVKTELKKKSGSKKNEGSGSSDRRPSLARKGPSSSKK